MAAEGSHRFHPPFCHSEFTFINVVPSSQGQVPSTSLIRIVQHVKAGTQLSRRNVAAPSAVGMDNS
jgi:hypothetical protein